MDYGQALKFLEGLSKFGSNLGLARVERLLEGLGNPQQGLPVVHVAGTNGKGSTAAMVASIVKEAGYKVGLYTSPHLSSYRERLTIDGKPVSQGEFGRLLGRVAPLAREVAATPDLGPVTEFEALTAAALEFFYHSQVDLAVVEVGLGGRLDATNVVEPLVSIITPIALDHMAVLGATLPAIAGEKAGIIKPGKMVVMAPQEQAAKAVLEQVCREKKAPLLQVGRDVGWHNPRFVPAGSQADFWTPQGEVPGVNVALLGRHQLDNAATALAAITALRNRGFAMADNDIYQGLVKVRWPGRMELVPGQPPALLDVAHNPHGVAALVESLAIHFPRQQVVLLFGALADKDVPKMVEMLTPVVDQVVVTWPLSPRALDPVEVASYFAPGQVIVEEDLASAVALAKGLARAGQVVVICGSFYLVGAARQLITDYGLK